LLKIADDGKLGKFVDNWDGVGEVWEIEEQIGWLRLLQLVIRTKPGVEL
jgi:hypothetical protein